MIYPGHLGSGLTLRVTGLDAFKMICRPDLEVAHTVSTSSASSDLIPFRFDYAVNSNRSGGFETRLPRSLPVHVIWRYHDELVL